MHHGHSHDGGKCGHSHGSGNFNVGFGDEEEAKQKLLVRPPPLMMQSGEASNTVGMGAMNPMMMMMSQQMTPQMMEFAKKMHEQRQILMKEFMEQGGNSNPQAVQDLMTKASQIQAQAMAQFKAASLANNTSSFDNSSGQYNPTLDISNNKQQSKTNDKSDTASNLLNANLNSSKLDELINKNSQLGQPKKNNNNEEENRILDAIAKKDYSSLNAIKATQYGVLERLKELVESGECDPHKPDHENVYLLHWAAINNRIDIAKYLIGIGCNIDQIGGELESTPLNWAARSGHVQMVIVLIQNGANPKLFDIEGFSTLHLATMFAHSNVVAYLLVNGVDPDMPDKNGVSALMYAAQRVHSRDPAQLLITFNARLNAQDQKGNTPLHYCVAFNNAAVMKVLLSKGASLDIRNNKGQTPIDFAHERKKFGAANMLRAYSDLDKEELPNFLKPISMNKDIRKMFTRLYPFLVLFYFGILFESSGPWLYKAIFFGLFYVISYGFKRLIFDKNINKYIPIATTIAFITWLYVTWLIYFAPHVFGFSLYSLLFLLATSMSWYNLYKAAKEDPGVLKQNQDQMNQTILKLVEKNEFSIDQFCSACIIRKPLRSKHCAECDRCVAKFDHHCPWVDNCIGQNNLKYFVGFLFWTPICLAFYLHGALIFYRDTCFVEDTIIYKNMTSLRMAIQFLQCSPWVGFFTIIALFNFIWISILCICHIYQSVFLSMTTNERMNFYKYQHFQDKNGKYRNPFNFGFLQNFIDLVEMKLCCLKPTVINWKREHDVEDFLKSRLDKKKEKYDIV